MSLIQSRPYPDTPWRDVIAAAILAVALPSALGLALLGIVGAVGQRLPPEGGLVLWAAGMALALSPLLSAPGMMLSLPFSVLLIRLGWFGWGPAAVTGLAIGATLGAVLDFPPGAVAGLAILLIQRVAFGRMRPMTPTDDPFA